MLWSEVDDYFSKEFSFFKMAVQVTKGFVFKDISYYSKHSDTWYKVDMVYQEAEDMIVLKNGDKYFSCLTNGGGTDYIEFSAHKTIEGFDLVKTQYQKRYTILYFRGNSIAQSGREALSEVVIEGQSISINPTTIFYDPSATAFYLSDFREFFGLSPEFEVVSQFDKEDSILYDASVSENTSFLMDEFQGTFSVNQNNLYFHLGTWKQGKNAVNVNKMKM